MSCNDLGPDAAMIIANSLLANEHTKLKELRISHNSIGEQGALALVEYFKTYDCLECLAIS